MTRSSVLGRRALLGGAVGALGGAACSNRSAGQGSTQATAEGWIELPFAADADQREGQHAIVLLPPGANDLPVLIALHGRGEASRGLQAGARGWRDDYALDAARARVAAPPLTSDDASDMLSSERLAALNTSLTAKPFGGLTVACPYTPVPSGRDAASARPFGRFVTKTLLGKVAEARGSAVLRAATGIDGVSMGGRYALQLGFDFPEVFGAVGALQPAIQEHEAAEFAELAAAARARAPASIRLVSSDDDPFLEATKRLSAELDRRRVPHTLVVTAGPHDYAWNRGPGAIELLLFHDRALRGLDVT